MNENNNAAIIAEFVDNLNREIKSYEITDKSAWNKGVQLYAKELAAELIESIHGGYTTLDDLKTNAGRKAAILNGAKDWNQYSYGGCSLCYDYDIAERLCTPSELKRTDGGFKAPNKCETWLDVQARALSQAGKRVTSAVYFALDNIGMEA